MTEAKHIVLVEDDMSLAQWFYDYLVEQGFFVTLINRGDIAIEMIPEEQPDLVILDVMLPGNNGFEVCQQIKPDYHGPILMMTARDDETDEVLGLELGADDYVTKPVKPKVLLTRVKTLLRRTQGSNGTNATSNVLQFGELKVTPNSQAVELNQKRVSLSSNEFKVLMMLLNSVDNVISRDQLIKEYRGIEYDGFDRTIDIIISRLRRKLLDDAKNPFRIKTIWGQGYLLASNAWS